MANLDINSDTKQLIRHSGHRFYEVAEKLGIADTTFSRKLRHELSAEDKAKIRAIIDQLKGATA
jgi:hypothetical protein